MGYAIGAVGKKDIPELIELRMAYLAADFGSIEEDDERAIRKTLPGYFERHLGDDLIAFAMRDDDGTGPVASIALMLVSEKPANPRFPNGHIGTVFNVYTVPEHRRRGLAREVMSALVADTASRKLDLVELNATDEGYDLYRSIGFADADLHRPMSIEP